MRGLAALVILLFASDSASTADLSGLYSDTILRERASRYGPNVRWNFENVVLGRLTARERTRLGTVELGLPLHAEGAARGDPFAYYADSQSRTVTIPIMSLKFLDDLSVAWSYAEARGLDSSAVRDYVAVLKYRDPTSFSPGGFPPPLEALGVPPQALDDRAVDDVAQKALKSAIVWLMAHEVGHVFYRHPGYRSGSSAVQIQEREAQADRFATEIMRRVRVAPVGLGFFFTVATAWAPSRADFPDDAKWLEFLNERATHPLNGARLRAVGEMIADQADRLGQPLPGESVPGPEAFRATGRQVIALGTLLDDPDIHQVILARALAADAASLKLRKAGALVPMGNTIHSEGTFCGSFTGTYRHRVAKGGVERLTAAMNLECTGVRVTGRFVFGMGEGRVVGRIRDNALAYEWTWGDALGRGVLAGDGRGQIRGEWGYGQSATGGGSWDLKRQ